MSPQMWVLGIVMLVLATLVLLGRRDRRRAIKADHAERVRVTASRYESPSSVHFDL